jgi:hypothetical protein
MLRLELLVQQQVQELMLVLEQHNLIPINLNSNAVEV